MNHVEAVSCSGKKKYATPLDAGRHKERLKLRELRIYKCEFCQHYHLGNLNRKLSKKGKRLGHLHR